MLSVYFFSFADFLQEYSKIQEQDGKGRMVKRHFQKEEDFKFGSSYYAQDIKEKINRINEKNYRDEENLRYKKQDQNRLLDKARHRSQSARSQADQFMEKQKIQQRIQRDKMKAIKDRAQQLVYKNKIHQLP